MNVTSWDRCNKIEFRRRISTCRDGGIVVRRFPSVQLICTEVLCTLTSKIRIPVQSADCTLVTRYLQILDLGGIRSIWSLAYQEVSISMVGKRRLKSKKFPSCVTLINPMKSGATSRNSGSRDKSKLAKGPLKS